MPCTSSLVYHYNRNALLCNVGCTMCTAVMTHSVEVSFWPMQSVKLSCLVYANWDFYTILRCRTPTEGKPIQYQWQGSTYWTTRICLICRACVMHKTGAAPTAQDEMEEQQDLMHKVPEVPDDISASVGCSFWFKDEVPDTDSGILKWGWCLRPMKPQYYSQGNT